MSSLTREAELALLIADQQKDDTERVWSSNLSLDKALGEDADSATFLDFIGTDFYGEDVGTTRTEARDKKGPTDKELAYWKYLHFRRKWTYRRIAEMAGYKSRQAVEYHFKRRYRRDSASLDYLEAQFVVAKATYERGARLIDIATEMYEDAGYASPASCYQALRLLFATRRVAVRTNNWKHGRLSATASYKTKQAYWKEQNDKAAAARRSKLTRCASQTREGKRCKRWALEGTTACINHSPSIERRRKWTAPVIADAMSRWTAENGRLPQAKDWTHATDWHPNFKTVYSVFGSWVAAVEEATSEAADTPLAPTGTRASSFSRASHL